MRHPRIRIALLPALLSAPLAAQSRATPPEQVRALHTTVALVAERDAIVPGASTWLGVRFVLESGWHIYWLNPGDSGNPPTIAWRLPPGVTTGPIEWPAPERIPVSSLVNYGYHGDIVLPVELRVPVTLKAGTTLTVGARVKWLVCQEVCVPGQADLELRMPVAPSSQPGPSATLIAQARARVPRPAPDGWTARATSDGDFLLVSIDTGRPERQGVFFPLDVSQINDSAPQRVTPLDRGVRFTLRKSNQLVKLPATLRGVVRLSDGPAFVVAAPVAQGAR